MDGSVKRCDTYVNLSRIAIVSFKLIFGRFETFYASLDYFACPSWEWVPVQCCVSLEWVWRNNIRGNIINYGSVKRRDTYNGLHWSYTTRTHNSKRGGRSHHVELQNLISSDQGFFTSFFLILITNHLFYNHIHTYVLSQQLLLCKYCVLKSFE